MKTKTKKIKAWVLVSDGQIQTTYDSDSNFRIFGKKWEADLVKIRWLETVTPCEIIIKEKIK